MPSGCKGSSSTGTSRFGLLACRGLGVGAICCSEAQMQLRCRGCSTGRKELKTPLENAVLQCCCLSCQCVAGYSQAAVRSRAKRMHLQREEKRNPASNAPFLAKSNSFWKLQKTMGSIYLELCRDTCLKPEIVDIFLTAYIADRTQATAQHKHPHDRHEALYGTFVVYSAFRSDSSSASWDVQSYLACRSRARNERFWM